MQRKVRGTVAIEDKQGKLRLRLPRTVAIDSQRYIATRLEATPDNFKKAQRVAWEIEEDIQSGQLELTLERYHQQFRPKQTLVKPTRMPDLGELWDSYCEYRKPQVEVTTFVREYRGRYASHIQKLPTQDLAKAITIRDYLVTTLSPGCAKRVLTQISACCK